jgi:hypothetical protein
MTKSKIQPRPNVSAQSVDAFINGAPDAAGKAAPAVAPVSTRSPDPELAGGRKKPISLTIEPSILAELDRVARGLGISRASAFSLAVSRFIAQEKKEA